MARAGHAPAGGECLWDLGAPKRLFEVAAVRNVEDHRVAAPEQRLAKALPVAVMQDAIPPVSTSVLGNKHHVDAALLCWQVPIFIFNLVEVVADRLHDGAEWRLNGNQADAREEVEATEVL